MMEVKRLLGLATQWLLARVLRFDASHDCDVSHYRRLHHPFFGWILLPLAH